MIDRTLLHFSLLVLPLLCCGSAQAQQTFDLSVPGTGISSSAEVDAAHLKITQVTEQEKRAFTYRRDRNYDTPGYVGFSNLQLRQAIRWPATNRGNFQIAAIDGDNVVFGPSRMQIFARQIVRKPIAPQEPVTLNLAEGLGDGRLYAWSVGFSRDGKSLAASAQTEGRGELKYVTQLWESSTRRLQRPIPNCYGVSFGSNDILAAVNSGGKVAVIDLQTRKEDVPPDIGDVRPGYLTFSPDGKLLAVATRQEVQLWGAVTRSAGTAAVRVWRRLPVELPAVDPGYQSVAFNRDGKLLALAGKHTGEGTGLLPDTHVRIWNISEGGVERQVLEGHQLPVVSVAFSPDDKVLASVGAVREGDAPSEIKLWYDEFESQQALAGHQTQVVALAFSPDGNILATAGRRVSDKSGVITLWDLSRGPQRTKPVATFEAHEDFVYSVAFSPDGETLASVGGDQAVKLWDVQLNPAPPDESPPVQRIILTVRDAQQPNLLIGDAEIVMARMVAEDDGNIRRLVRVDAKPEADGKGNYQLRLESGEYVALVSKEGYERAQEEIVVKDRAFEATILLSRVNAPRPENEVVITVQDEQQPDLLIKDAEISIERVPAKPKPDGQGGYTVALNPGDYRVTVEKEGYKSTTQVMIVPERGNPKPILLTRSILPPVPEQRIVLNVKDEQQQPVNDASILVARVIPQEDGKPDTYVRVDAKPTQSGKGDYLLKLEPGDYLAIVKKDGYLPARKSFPVIRNPEGLDRVAVLLKRVDPPPPAERNIVILLRDEEQKDLPIKDAEISIEGVPVKPDGQGGYAMALKPGKNYQLLIKNDRYEFKTTSIAVKDKAVPDTIYLTRASVPTSGATLVLSVVDKEKGEPIDKADISFAKADAKQKPSGAAGIYIFEQLKQGTSYEVTVKADNYEPKTETVTLKAEVYQYPIKLNRITPTTPTEPFQVAVSVVDDQQRPISGLNVIADPGIQFEPNQAQDQFDCRFTPGTYEIAVQMAGFTFKPQLVTVADDGHKLQLQASRDEAAEDQLLDALMTRLDTNLNGVVERSDFPSDAGWEEILALSDSNKDGVLSEKEVRELAASSNRAPTESDPEPPTGEEEPAEDDLPSEVPSIDLPSEVLSIDELLAQLRERLDSNRDKSVTIDDFPSEQGWQEFLQIFDGNRDNKIDDDELADYVRHSFDQAKQLEAEQLDEDSRPDEQPPIGEIGEDEFVEQLRARLDTDRNGKVEKADFSDLGWQDFKTYDTNNNENLSDDELRPLIQPADDEPIEEPADPTEPLVRGKLIIRKTAGSSEISPPSPVPR